MKLEFAVNPAAVGYILGRKGKDAGQGCRARMQKLAVELKVSRISFSNFSKEHPDALRFCIVTGDDMTNVAEAYKVIKEKCEKYERNLVRNSV